MSPLSKAGRNLWQGSQMIELNKNVLLGGGGEQVSTFQMLIVVFHNLPCGVGMMEPTRDRRHPLELIALQHPGHRTTMRNDHRR